MTRFLGFIISLSLTELVLVAPSPQEPPRPDPPREAAKSTGAFQKQAIPVPDEAKSTKPAEPAKPEGPVDPTRPTMVALDFKDRPIQEVVNAIASRTGNPVSIQFWNEPEGNPRKITLAEPAPVPFWQALDRFCEATKIQRNLNDGSGLNGRRSSISLYGPGVDPGPACYSGPFRFGKLTLHANFDHNFLPATREPSEPDPGTYAADIEVLTEPKVIAIRTGPLARLEATDDRGHSLIKPDTAAERTSAALNTYALGAFQSKLRVPLSPPGSQSKRLMALQGVMPVEIGILPKQSTTSIPLAGSTGKTFHADDLRVTVEEFTARPGGSATLRLLIRIEGERGPGGKSPTAVIFARAAAVQKQLEAVDRKGQVLTSSSGSTSLGDDIRLSHTFSPNTNVPGKAEGSPTHLHIYAPKWVRWDAPFEFFDVPLPEAQPSGAPALMTLLPWLVLATLGPTDDESPQALVQRLASSHAEERGQAVDALDALGFRALPTLREYATGHAGEMRTQAERLLERIGTRRLIRATPVQARAKDVSVAEAVAGLESSSGFFLDLDPTKKSTWADRKVSIESPSPIGFFEALDRLGAVGGFRHDPSPFFARRATPDVRVRLVPYEGPVPPMSYAGPYRLILLSLDRHREVVQARTPEESKIREEFFARLELSAEPGILIDRNGTIHLNQAEDDRGRDLRPGSTADPAPMFTPRQWSQEQIGTFIYRLPLQLPADRGRSIARLRGYVPITSVTRTDEIFSSPVVGLEGKTLSSGGVTLKVIRALMTGSNPSMDVSIQGERPPDPKSFAAGPRQTTLANIKLGYSLDDHLRVEDANGIPYVVTSNATSPPLPDGSMNFRVNLYTNRPAGPAAKLRYFGVAAVATEIPFDFKDLPIP